MVLESLRSADALLFPSMHDSAPWAIGEAIILGTPVVSLDVCGPRLLIERTHGGTAIAPTGDVVTKLAQALNSTLDLENFSPNREPISAARLPQLLDAWYASVISSDG